MIYYIHKEREAKKMTDYRKALIERMIHLYGIEDEITVDFTDLCERFPNTRQYDNALRCIVETHEKDYIYMED